MRGVGRVGVGCCVVALAAVSVVGPATKATASSLAPTSLDSLAAQSTLVVLGRVVQTRAVPNGPQGQTGIHTRVTLEVDRAVPETGERSVTFWVHGGRIGDRLRRVTGQARFERGEDVAVFLRATESGALWPTQMARGKWWRVSAGGGRYVMPSVALRGHPAPLPRPESVVVAAPMSSPRLPGTALLERDFLERARAARGTP